MAERRVISVDRDGDGVTRALCNPGEAWSPRASHLVIGDIEHQRHSYRVEVEGDDVGITVVRDPDGAYLRTEADDELTNNLDSLPLCEHSPWDVVHDDAEVLAVHAALVPPGDIVYFGGDEHSQEQNEGGDIHNTRLYVVDDNAVVDIDSPPADVFCCGHAFLGDGRLIVGGGTESWRGEHHAHNDPLQHYSGSRECALYNHDDRTWSAIADFLPEPGHATRGGGRWYPTLLTLADGRILAVGGHPRVNNEDEEVNDQRHGSWHPEVYDPTTDSWSYVGGDALYVSWPENPFAPGEELPLTARNYLYYPRMYVVPEGTVFLVSPNLLSCGWYDPVTGSVGPVSVEAPPYPGAPAKWPYRETNHTAVLLPLLPGEDYQARILCLAGNTASRIVLGDSAAEPAPEWEVTERDWPGEAPQRRHGCATLLPTGQVFFSGGINFELSESPDLWGVTNGELYSPGIDWAVDRYTLADEWTTVPRANVVRNYHSVALLLPDGRVFTAGSNLDGQSGGQGTREYRIEMYSPPYLDPLAARPQIQSAPSSVTYGESFPVATTQAHDIQRVALLRCGSVTHAWDGDQRYVGLEFTVDGTEGLLVEAPPHGAVAPPGNYMLWVVNGAGIPSRRAAFVHLS